MESDFDLYLHLLQISEIQVRIDQGLAVKIRYPMRFLYPKYKPFIFFFQIQAEPGLRRKKEKQNMSLASEARTKAKVQRADLTCDVIRKVTPFVLNKL